jgi:hypothetical protein
VREHGITYVAPGSQEETTMRAFGTTLALSCLCVASVALGQSGENMEKPPTWRARYDAGSAAVRGHVVMRPGWHVNPGPAGIFWDPSRFASGNYGVSSTIFLFSPGQGEPAAQVEAPYGLVLAGEDLDGSAPSYVTFVIRNDGSFRVAHHAGDETHEIVPWTAHDAVVVWTSASEGTAENRLGVDATDEAVTFWVNDAQVSSLPRSQLPMAGVVGVRAGDGLSLHITDIEIGPNRR